MESGCDRHPHGLDFAAVPSGERIAHCTLQRARASTRGRGSPSACSRRHPQTCGAIRRRPDPSTPIDACGPRLTKPDGGTWTCSFADEFGGSSPGHGRNGSHQNTRDDRLQDRRDLLPRRPRCRRALRVRCGWYAQRPRTRRSTATIPTEVPQDSLHRRPGRQPAGTSPRRSVGSRCGRSTRPRGRQGCTAGSGSYPLGHPYGPWPASGEIDVAEWWSIEARAGAAVPPLQRHTHGTTPVGTAGSPMPASSTPTPSSGTATEMRFFIDGTNCWTREVDPRRPAGSPSAVRPSVQHRVEHGGRHDRPAPTSCPTAPSCQPPSRSTT